MSRSHACPISLDMTVNVLKLVLATLLAVSCIVALIIDADGNKDWAVPVLTLCVGYVIGNAQVTSQTGSVAPIISTKESAGG